MRLNMHRIKILMIEKKLNKTKLASKSGLSRNGLTYIFKKGRAEFDSVGKIASALDASVEEITIEED